ncbi:tripartite motif-containing protein 29-like [Engraulis encrasicolus]|uniref:tripartite motif-containing protein 29-like n=1 Tax=Engraulis encrasicolus TaxID=184585 RepID=UPI002FD468E0
MAEMVEEFRKTRIQAAAPDHCYAGPGDVACDVCTGRKLKAVKSCLECLLSYCDTHLKTHNELVGKNHTVIDTTGQLQERICSRHKKTAVEESEKMFTEIVCSIESMCFELNKLIRAQEKAEVSRTEGLLKQLEQEIAVLKRTDAEMKKLSLTQDPIYFLKNMGSIAGDQYSAVARRTFRQSHFFEPLKESVSALKMQLKEKLESVFKQEKVKISALATKAQIITCVN